VVTIARRSAPAACIGAIAAISAISAIAEGCSPGPISHPTAPVAMNRPVPLGSDASSGAIETVRRDLQGTWELTALEWASTAGAARVPITASGTLVYDEYGNLTIDAHTTDPAAPVAAQEATLPAFKGRAVIDVTRHELKLMDVTGNVNPDEVLAPENRRKYEIAADRLTLSSFDEREQVTAVSTWHRRQ
jgi:hypothetical protein